MITTRHESARPASVTYIARAACGCVRLTVTTYVGVPLVPVFGKMLADAVSKGYALETVPSPELRDFFTSRCDVCDPPKPVQESLF